MKNQLIKIAICDDDIQMCSEIENAILEYDKVIPQKLNIEVYCSGGKLCNDLDRDVTFDILFLDIELTGTLNGVSIGHYIREKIKNEALKIIYISSHKKYALELFKVRPTDFLIKPITDKMVWKILKLCIELLKDNEISFQYKQGRDSNKILIKNIIYFKSNDREVEMVTTKSVITFYESLESIYAELNDYLFFYVHKSYLVNYIHVSEFFYDRVVMSNNDIIKIAQNRRKKVREIQKNNLLLEKMESVD